MNANKLYTDERGCQHNHPGCTGLAVLQAWGDGEAYVCGACGAVTMLSEKGEPKEKGEPPCCFNRRPNPPSVTIVEAGATPHLPAAANALELPLHESIKHTPNNRGGNHEAAKQENSTACPGQGTHAAESNACGQENR